MREKKIFAIRSKVLKTDIPLKKYLLVCEGEKTEHIYFNAVNNIRQELGINPLIEIVPIIRSFSEKGYSNPKKIIEYLEKGLEEHKTGKLSHETVLNKIMEYLVDEKLISKTRLSKEIIWERLEKTIKNKGIEMFEYTDDFLEISNILGEELMKLNINEIIPNLKNILEQEDIEYKKGLDKICVIVDRDKDSFTKKQFNDVIKKCDDNQFGFYVTNPCFEFWLLLHYDDINELDKEKLKENCNVSGKKRYAESELCKRHKGYKKSKYKAEGIVKKVDTAIKNEKEFCEDIELLENSIGSNLGILMQELKSNVI